MERFDKFQTQKNYLETQNFEIFDKVVHNFGKSDDVIIYRNRCISGLMSNLIKKSWRVSSRQWSGPTRNTAIKYLKLS